MSSPPAPSKTAARGFGAHAERAATWLSLACAVHCLLVPVALGAMPLLGGAGVGQLGPSADRVLTVLVVASALAGAGWGYRRHRDLRFVLATALGLGTYLIGHVLERNWYGIALAVVGALTLAASAFLSARVSHVHDASCDHQD